jgi:glutathione S-transferase
MSDNPVLPLLYSYRRCPYAMRARLAMLQANRRFQTFEIVMRDKPAELLALSPKGTVPVLRLTDGWVL